MKYYLGTDIGNGTIKTVLLTEKKELADYVYIQNNGAIESVQKALKILKEHLDLIGSYEIKGVGVIGAGRNLISKLIGSDIIRTEILSTAVGVLNYHLNVKTIFDLGKEDSKILCLENGILTDFSMNAICSAGCGAYLDNVAYRLGIYIDDFAGIALKSKNPSNISGKCSVFGTSSCVSQINSGAKKEDILRGVSKSLVSNYINMLGKGKELKPEYVFCGGVSQNKSVVKSLEEELNHEVIVPKYNTIIGAIGVALLTMEENIEKTNFKGFDLVNYDFKTKIRECKDCENSCMLNEIYQDKKLIGTLNSRCGKFN